MAGAQKSEGSKKPRPDRVGSGSNEAEPNAGSTDVEQTPAAGPHAKPELTNDMATPGAGALPDPDDDSDGAQDSTTG